MSDNSKDDFDDETFDQTEENWDESYGEYEEEEFFIDSDDDTGSEEWDSFSDDNIESEPAQNTGKKKNTNKIIIAGAVAAGLAVLGWQVFASKGGETKSPNSAAIQQQAQQTQQPLPENPIPSVEIPSADIADKTAAEAVEEEQISGFLNNPDILNDVEIAANNDLPMPTPISSQKEQDINPAPVPDILPADNNTPDALFPEPRPPTGLEDEDPAIESAANNERNIPSAEDFLRDAIRDREQNQRSAMDENPVVNNTPDAIDMTSADNPEQQALKEESMPPPAITSASVSNDIVKQLAVISQTLENLQNDIGTMRQNRSNDMERFEARFKELENKIGTAQKTVAAPPKARTQPTKTPKPAPRKTVNKPATAKTSSRAPQWELRAAQPGKAWISQKGQKAMRSLEVGDTLDGIGRITSIEYTNSLWVVRGTKGQIRQ